MKKSEIFDIEVIEEKQAAKEVVRVYLGDEFFEDLLDYIQNEDYALAKDAAKGLYILAQELKLFRLYESLIDIYEDIEGEFYDDLIKHYQIMKSEHERLLREYAHE